MFCLLCMFQAHFSPYFVLFRGGQIDGQTDVQMDRQKYILPDGKMKSWMDG